MHLVPMIWMSVDHMGALPSVTRTA